MLGGGGENVEFALPITWKGKNGEQKVQARTYLEEKMQNLAVNCSNTSDREKQAKILGCIWGTAFNVISMFFRDAVKAKL